MRLLASFLFLLLPLMAGAYPLDGSEHTGIERLEGYRLAQQGEVRGRRLHPGALLETPQVRLRLQTQKDMLPPAEDVPFGEHVEALLGDKDRYGIAVLDLSDPERPAYAEHRADVAFNPGSVGKLVVATALFHALAQHYPDDIAARERLLRETRVTADGFIRHDSHDVPFWDAEKRRLSHRPLRVGDEANLWTWLDWMLSASSNAAASMVLREVMLLHHFGPAYPLPEDEVQRFFRETPRKRLSEILAEAVDAGVRAAGLDPRQFRQGGFFTREGKRRVPGRTSRATPRQLLLFLLHLEQGKVVDEFSSLELKRLLYMTQKRIRYASSPALSRAALYFKSGSLYRCKPEPGFTCRKYHGNVLNVLNSVAIVESPAGETPSRFYLVALTSNVLRKNSAVEHQTLATRLHRLIAERNRHRTGLKD